MILLLGEDEIPILLPPYKAMLVADCPSLVSFVMIDTMTKSNLGGKGFFGLQVTVHHLGKSGQEFRAETRGLLPLAC